MRMRTFTRVLTTLPWVHGLFESHPLVCIHSFNARPRASRSHLKQFQTHVILSSERAAGQTQLALPHCGHSTPPGQSCGAVEAGPGSGSHVTGPLALVTTLAGRMASADVTRAAHSAQSSSATAPCIMVS